MQHLTPDERDARNAAIRADYAEHGHFDGRARDQARHQHPGDPPDYP